MNKTSFNRIVFGAVSSLFVFNLQCHAQNVTCSNATHVQDYNFTGTEQVFVFPVISPGI